MAQKTGNNKTGFRKMTVAQLDTYAREKDIDFPDTCTTKEAKVNFLESLNGDEVSLNVGGEVFTVPVSRASDLRVLRALRDNERATEAEDTMGQVFASIDLIDALFGDISDEVEKALQEPDGTVPTEKVARLANDYFQKANAKN